MNEYDYLVPSYTYINEISDFGKQFMGASVGDVVQYQVPYDEKPILNILILNVE